MKNEKYVNDFCLERGTRSLFFKRININEFAKKTRRKRKKMSTEIAGREDRYKFFKEVMKKTNGIIKLLLLIMQMIK